MRCEEVLNQLNARADGELPPEDAAGLDAHLAECSPCRAAAEGSTIDAELRRAFVPRREAAARLAENVPRPRFAPRRSARRVGSRARWRPSRVWPGDSVLWPGGWVSAGGRAVPALADREPDRAGFIRPLAGAHRSAGGRVGPGRSAAGQPDRLLHLSAGLADRAGFGRPHRTDRAMRDLAGGRQRRAARLQYRGHAARRPKWSKSTTAGSGRAVGPAARGSKIQSGGGTIVAKEAAQLAVDCQPKAVRLIVVDGAANVQTGQESMEVGPGEQVRIVAGKGGSRSSSGATPFGNGLGQQRAGAAQLRASGAGRARQPVAGECRRREVVATCTRMSCGGWATAACRRCWPTWLRRATRRSCPASDRGADRGRRGRIALDRRHDRAVDRCERGRAVSRGTRPGALTGRDQGCQPQTWQSESWASCESPHQKWLDWWTANRDRYPAARRDIPAPTSPPF